jgi:signal transduction histidine kinase
MLPRFWGSLRFRIVAYSLLAFGLVLTILSFYIFTTYERYLREEFDARLRESASSVSETIAIRADATVTPVPQISPYRFTRYFFLIRTSDGRVLEKSINLGQAELPFSSYAQSATKNDAGVIETIVDGAIAQKSQSGELRLLTVYHHGENTAPYYLQMASSLDLIDRNISQLRRTVLAAFLIGLLVAGLSAFLVAWRSLRSISNIARQAKDLNASKLDQRIDRPHSEDEVAYLVDVINGMLDRLEKAFNAQERFIADVSHEFRTPLSILLGQAQLLRQQRRPIEKYDEFVVSVQEEMRQLAQLVTSLLTLSRAHAGLNVPGMSQVSVNEFVVEAVERCTKQADEKQVRLLPALPYMQDEEETPDPMVEGEMDLLCTMLSNLIRNAIKFSPPKETVEIRVSASSELATIVVADRGPGIPIEHISGLFDRFYQVPKAVTPKSGVTGSGLGLAIAKGVVEMQKGAIEARNREGGGSEFIIRLPLSTPELVGVS